MLIKKIVAVFLFCLIALTTHLSSQHIVLLEGVVTDQGNDSVEGALVELIGTDQTYSYTTHPNGYYIIDIMVTNVGDTKHENPGNFKLFQNFPNPFNPSTVIEYEVLQPAAIKIEIHNVLGQKIKTLFDGFQVNRTGRLVWDATDDSGRGVATGVYFCTMTTGDSRISKKMVLIDGNQGSVKISPAVTGRTKVISQKSEQGQFSNGFLLQVTGDNMLTYEENIVITESRVHDITVSRYDDESSPIYLYNVVRSFNKIWESFHHLIRLRPSEDFFYNFIEVAPLTEDSHIQGIQRLRGENIFVLSSSQRHPITMIKLDGKIGFAEIQSLDQSCIIDEFNTPLNEDGVTHSFPCRNNYFHAGGISLCGNILAVPLTDETWPNHADNVESYIHVYNVSDYNNLQGSDILTSIHRPAGIGSNASAVALTRFPNGPYKDRYLLANNAYGSYGPIDFYISISNNIQSGFEYIDSLSHPILCKGECMQFLTDVRGIIYLAFADVNKIRLVRLNINDTGELPEFTWSDVYTVVEPEIPDDYSVGGFGFYICPESGILNYYVVRSFTAINGVNHGIIIYEFPGRE